MPPKRKTNKTETVTAYTIPFYSFIWNQKANRNYLLFGLGVGIIYFIILRLLFPFPSFYYDSYTYVQAARDNYAISFRPIGYSDFIRFFHGITTSDFALILTQYLVNVLANLFIFFTFLYFFPLKRAGTVILFVLLTCNPFYLFYSNYVLSDSFFCAFTIIWFALLIWIAKKPSWYLIAAHVLLMLLLFKLRYNALIYPFFFFTALLFSGRKLVYSLGLVAINGIFLFLMIQHMTELAEDQTGERVFAPFSGWQMANDAMHVLRDKKADTTDFTDDQLVLNRMIRNYFDTVKVKQEGVTSDYMWNAQSPLKKYVLVHAQKYGFPTYFQVWTALGPIYNDYGKKVILQEPMTYMKNFILPNIKEFYSPQMEAYEQYNEGRDSIELVARQYYHYPNQKVDLSHEKLSTNVFGIWRFLFPVLNCIFCLLFALYFISGTYKNNTRLFNSALINFTLFYFGNIFFVALVAKNAFRYHVFIITLSFIFCTYLIHSLFQKKANRSMVTGLIQEKHHVKSKQLQ